MLLLFLRELRTTRNWIIYHHSKRENKTTALMNFWNCKKKFWENATTHRWSIKFIYIAMVTWHIIYIENCVIWWWCKKKWKFSSFEKQNEIEKQTDPSFIIIIIIKYWYPKNPRTKYKKKIGYHYDDELDSWIFLPFFLLSANTRCQYEFRFLLYDDDDHKFIFCSTNKHNNYHWTGSIQESCFVHGQTE